jgi:uncharacterized protein
LKYLLWAVIGYLVWRWFKASKRNKAEGSVSPGTMSQSTHPDTEAMVKCAQCGLHLPISEALPGSSNQFFCSDAHRGSRNAE